MRTFGNTSIACGGAGLCIMLFAATAQAAINISTQATENMSCSAGVCTPTAQKAYLNVADITNMLAAGDLKITTGGGTLGQDIRIEAPFSWTSTSRLTLEANRNITMDAAITVAGTGALTVHFAPALIPPSGNVPQRRLSFGPGAHIQFWDLSSSLIIQDTQYKLVKDWVTIRRALKNSYGPIALAISYDAANDGTHDRAPLPILNTGFEGLGNTIANLTVVSPKQYAGLIGENGGTIRNLVVTNVNITGTTADVRHMGETGGLVGLNEGTIENCYVDGVVSSEHADAGGLVGEHSGSIISNSHSHVRVSGVRYAGGLVGDSEGTISDSSANGNVQSASVAGGLIGFSNDGFPIQRNYAMGSVSGGTAGGLVGVSFDVENSYATGAVTGAANAGGLLGYSVSGRGVRTSWAYSTGAVTASNLAGGFAGQGSGAYFTDAYWDLDTSGISDPAQGAGDVKNMPGITGLTDAQLKSALPDGFDPKVWGQDPKINNGYPYLLANPPPT